MDVFKALILGIIQGLTEFLPVSSSGHIELGQKILCFTTENDLAFSIIVHLATVFSTIIVFRKDIAQLLGSLLTFQWNEENKYILMLLVSALPVGLAGFFFKDQIEELFTGKILLVGCMLIVTAFLLFSTTFFGKQKGKMTFGKAIIIGLAQMIAIFPGISRSGATISTALNLGIEKEKAARFSFLMVLFPILGASLLEIKDLSEQSAQIQTEVIPLLAGFVGAFISGWLACTWMLRIVKRGKIPHFAYYCLLAGFFAIGIHVFQLNFC